MSDSFFKYTTLDSALKIIKNQTVQFSRPYLFNDPFDLLLASDPQYSDFLIAKQTITTEYKKILSKKTIPLYDPAYAEEQLKAEIIVCNPERKDHLRKLYKKLEIAQKGEITDPKDISKVKTHIGSQLTNNLDQATQEHLNIERSGRENLQREIDDFFIFCGSLTKNNILMWSHYANSHKGIVLEFSLNEGSSFKGMKTIKYKNRRQNYNDLNGLFETKAKCWEYEKEVRGYMNRKTQVPSNDKTVPVPYNPKDLIAIYFGANTSTAKGANSTKEISLIKNSKKLNSNIIFYKMECDSLKYELNHSLINV